MSDIPPDAKPKRVKQHPTKPEDICRFPVPGIPINREKFKELLIKYRGNLTKCADALGCARQSLSRIIDTDEQCKSVMEDARERAVDMVEDTFTQKCIDGTDTTAGIFFLKTRGRHRGFDQELRSDLDAVMRTALAFALNKTKNPADSNTDTQND